MSTHLRQQLHIVQSLRDGSIRKIPLNGAQSIQAEAGSRYAIVDAATGKTPDNLQVRRHGDSLIIESEDPTLRVEIAGFYQETGTVFVPSGQLNGETLTGIELTSSSPVLSTTATGDSIVWSAGSDTNLWPAVGVAGLGAVGVGVAVGNGGAAATPDTIAPVITSGATAAAINENSGAGQVVYTTTATDASTVTYSLKPVGDFTAFSIDANTGAVTLTGNPDFETQASFNFTVIATDAAGNASEQAVSLGINDQVDEVAPQVSSVAITSATGAQNSTLNAGDVVSVTVTMNEATVVTGTPQLALNIGGTPVQANYVSGSGTTALVFTYTIQAGQTDANGIAIGANALTLNGGTLRDAAGNNATLTHGAVADNAGFLVDTAAPAVSSVAITSATGSQNSTLNAGDVVSVTVTMNEATVVTGTPQLALNIGGTPVQANYVSGSGTTALVFTYTIQAGQTDANGIAIGANALTLNGGTLRDAAGNNATLTHGAVADNAGFLVDTTAPAVTSGATATAINENSGAGQTVYTAAATDAAAVTYSLKPVGDAAAFSINAGTGAVTLTGNPDFETKASYAFTVVATDAAGNASEQAVSLAVNNRDEVAPSFTSGATATAINENSGAGQTVYTATSTDAGDIATGATTYSLKPVGDAAAFSINAGTGAVTLTGNPDFETKNSYAFTVVATDAAGNTSEQAVSLAINNLDEVAPSFTSGATATAINENSGASQVIYTATSTDAVDFVSGATTYSLKAVGDAAAFSINAGTGAVTLTGNPDFETKASYAFTVIATDAAGNASEQAVSLAINDLVDEVAPQVSSVAISSATGVQNSTLNVGDVVSVTVTMNEVTLVTGTPQLALNIGGTPVQANYVSGSGTTALVFTYTIQAGQTDGNGISIGANALTLNGGTLRDAAGNNATLTHGAVADNAGFLVDTAAPAVSSVAITSATGSQNSTLNAGDVVSVTVTMNEATVVTGTPQLALNIGGTPVQANYVSGSGTTALVFTYTIQAGQTDANGIAIGANALTLNGGTLRDAAGNNATLTHGAVADNAGFLVDTAAPAVGSVAITSATGSQNSTLNAGDVVSVTVTMNEATVVTGTPQLALNIGGTPVQANYVSGSGTTALVFTYTIQAGQTDANGIAIGANALTLNGGTLQDAAGNAAVLTHGAVTDNAGFRVDTSAPTLNSSTPTDNAAAVAVGDNIVLTFSENVFAGSGNIVISDGAGDTRIIAVGSGQVSIVGNQVTINPTADLNAGSTYNVQMASGVLLDAAGNAYTGISNATTLNFDTAAASVNVVFDLVNGVSSNHSGRAFDAATSYTIYIRVESDLKILDTTPDIALKTWGTWTGAANLGADDRIVLVGTGTPIIGLSGGPVTGVLNPLPLNVSWKTTIGSLAARMRPGGVFERIHTGPGGPATTRSEATLWTGMWAANPNIGETLPIFFNAMPAGILTSQGLT